MVLGEIEHDLFSHALSLMGSLFGQLRNDGRQALKVESDTVHVPSGQVSVDGLEYSE